MGAFPRTRAILATIRNFVRNLAALSPALRKITILHISIFAFYTGIFSPHRDLIAALQTTLKATYHQRHHTTKNNQLPPHSIHKLLFTLQHPIPITMTEFTVPGQYLTPTYKVGTNNTVEKYVPGRGTTVSSIEVTAKDLLAIPVVVATILGRKVIQEIASENTPNDPEATASVKNFLVSVVPVTNTYVEFEKEVPAAAASAHSVSINLPQEGDVVLVRVTRLTQKQANCEILSVEGHGNILNDLGLGSNGELAHKSLPMGGGSQSLSSHTQVASSQSTQANAISVDLGETFKGVIRSQDIKSTNRDKTKVIESFRPGDVVRAVVISLGDGSNYYLSTARNDLGVIFAKSEGGEGDLMYAIDWETMMSSKTGAVEKRKCANPFA